MTLCVTVFRRKLFSFLSFFLWVTVPITIINNVMLKFSVPIFYKEISFPELETMCLYILQLHIIINNPHTFLPFQRLSCSVELLVTALFQGFKEIFISPFYYAPPMLVRIFLYSFQSWLQRGNFQVCLLNPSASFTRIVWLPYKDLSKEFSSQFAFAKWFELLSLRKNVLIDRRWNTLEMKIKVGSEETLGHHFLWQCFHSSCINNFFWIF